MSSTQGIPEPLQQATTVGAQRITEIEEGVISQCWDGQSQELLGHVLQFVHCPETLICVVPLVCTQWRRCLLEYGGLHVDLKCFESPPVYNCFSYPNPTSKKFNGEVLQTLSKRFRHIRRLLMGSGCSVTDAALIMVVPNCKGLTELSTGGNVVIGATAIIQLAHSTLESISCGLWTQPAVQALTQGCPALHTLGLHDTELGDAESVPALMRSIGENCPGITSLDLTRSKKLTPTALREIGAAFLKLTRLCLDSTFDVDNDGLRALAESLSTRPPTLQELSLDDAFCDEVFLDEGVQAVCQACAASLKRLNVGAGYYSMGLSDQGAAALVSAPHLVSLELNYCRSLTDEAACAIAQSCPALQELNLGNHQVTDRGIAALVEGCSALTRLNLYGCLEVTDIGVQALGACASLQSLTLTGVRVSRDGLAGLAGCTALASLSLNNCTDQIRDPELRAIADACPGLTELDLLSCKLVTNEGIIALAAGCAALRTVNVQFCSQITHGLEAFIACPALAYLNAEYTGRTAARALGKLHEANPGCRIKPRNYREIEEHEAREAEKRRQEAEKRIQEMERRRQEQLALSPEEQAEADLETDCAQQFSDLFG